MVLRTGEECARAIAALLGATSDATPHETNRPTAELFAARKEESPTANYESEEGPTFGTRNKGPAPLELYTEQP